jgi:hypothetical protein
MATITAEGAGPETVARIATGLGWFSLGLGTPQLLAAGRVNRAAGIRNDTRSRVVQRLVGVRELAAGGGILGTQQPAPWLWARVAGDAMDLVLLGRAWGGKRAGAPRLFLATTSVAGIAALDLFAATRMPADSRPQRRTATVKTAAVTLDIAEAETQAAWARVASDFDVPGTPTFRPAPGGTGTEVSLRVERHGVADVARKAMGTEPYQQAKDALRRFKQLVEAGEIARSDAMPDGETHTRMFPRQRPAQPLEQLPA